MVGHLLIHGLRDPDWARLLAGDPRLLAAMGNTDLPDSLIDHVLDHGDRPLLIDLAGNFRVIIRRPDLADRLAEVLDPVEVFAALRGTRAWEYRHWEFLLRRWKPAKPISDETARSHELALGSRLVHSPLPAHHRRLRGHEHFSVREQVHALVWRRRHGEDDLPGFDPLVVARVNAAAAEPGGFDALIAEVDGTPAVLAELRGTRPHDIGRRGDLDWTAITAAHTAAPFGEQAAIALVSRTDCPEGLRHDLYARFPVPVARRSRPSWALLAAPVHDRGHRTLIDRVRREGRLAELVAHGRPAVEVLSTARTGDEKPRPDAHWHLHAFHTLVRGILARTVGASPAAWRTLRSLLGGHDGTIADMCEKAAASPDSGAHWPDAEPLPGLADEPGLAGARKAFLILLDAAGPQTQFALLPHLDPRTLHDLFVHGVYRREWFEHLIEHGTPEQLTAFAHSWTRLAPEQIRRLLDRGDPALTAALFDRQEHLTVDPDRRLHFHREIQALDEGADIAEVCASGPVALHGAHTWIEAAIGTGRATWTDVLRHGHPARTALTRAAKADVADLYPALREVVGEVDPTPEAFLLALEMFDDFAGSLSKLLATAEAVTATR